MNLSREGKHGSGSPEGQARRRGVSARTTKRLEQPPDRSLPFLQSASPELNSAESIGHSLRQTWLSNRVFDSDTAVDGGACWAWNKLRAETRRIAASTARDWAVTDQ